MRAVRCWALAAVLLQSVLPAAAQERFDLRDWKRKPIADSPALFYECQAPQLCGAGSAVSARLMALPKEALTVERQRAREAEIVRRMREQSDGKIKSVDVGETREIRIEQLPVIFTEKRVTPASGPARTDVAGIMTGKTRAYVVIATARTPEQARSNFSGMARVAALILDQMAADPQKPDANPRPQ